MNLSALAAIKILNGQYALRLDGAGTTSQQSTMVVPQGCYILWIYGASAGGGGGSSFATGGFGAGGGGAGIFGFGIPIFVTPGETLYLQAGGGGIRGITGGAAATSGGTTYIKRGSHSGSVVITWQGGGPGGSATGSAGGNGGVGAGAAVAAVAAGTTGAAAGAPSIWGGFSNIIGACLQGSNAGAGGGVNGGVGFTGSSCCATTNPVGFGYTNAAGTPSGANASGGGGGQCASTFNFLLPTGWIDGRGGNAGSAGNTPTQWGFGGGGAGGGGFDGGNGAPGYLALAA